MKKSNIGIIQILPTRVFRVYRGGYLLEKFRGIKNPQDFDYPEDRILSTVRAIQPYGISDLLLIRLLSQSSFHRTHKQAFYNHF